MKFYKLLTPGPLTTTDTVKKEMLFDHCTWDDDYKQITQKIRKQLLALAHASEEEYTVVLMQGSGTFGVESVLTSVIGQEDKLLIAANGAYGERMEDIAKHAKIDYTIYNEHYNCVPNAEHIRELLEADKEITHVSMVHSETTSGILNDIEAVAKVVKAAGKVFIVDAMSSFGGVDIPVQEWGIDFLISSANKCIQGVPGFSFIIARKSLLLASEGKARSLSLDLYDQWKTMNVDGKWRFTSPTHVVLAFAKALDEMLEEGGIEARNRRYTENNHLLIQKLGEMGIKTYIDGEHQGPIITTFFYPDNCNFSFQEMYHYIKERGYAIYPGKVTEADTFRIGNIGEIYKEDIVKLCDIIKEFLEEKKMRKFDAVIFDWAGTTVDYGCFAPVQAFVEVFRHFGIEPTMEEVRKPMGMLKIDHIRTMLQMERIKNCWVEKYGREPEETDVKKLFGLFEEKLLSILNQFADPKPGVVDAVAKIREMGYAVGSTTGYTDKMMAIVAPAAKEKGYAPDCWFSPDSTNQKGRPYPYMVFRNMETLGIQDVRRVVKVGDTASDIREGKNAGAYSVGVLVGSSEMGLSQEEYEALTSEEKDTLCKKTAQKFRAAGADEVVMDFEELIERVL